MAGLFIATPTHGGTVRVEYAASIAATVADLERRSIQTSFWNIDAANVADQRDALAEKFLKSPCSHLLFVDSDTGFPGDLVARWLEFDKPFVAAACAYRQIDLEQIRRGAPLAAAHDFNFSADGQREIVNGRYIEAQWVGFGMVLLSRAGLESMRGDLPTYPNRYAGQEVHGFFRPIDGLSEDLSFCRRWREAGQIIWVDVAADIKHIGTFAYGAPFIERAKAFGRLKAKD